MVEETNPKLPNRKTVKSKKNSLEEAAEQIVEEIISSSASTVEAGIPDKADRKVAIEYKEHNNKNCFPNPVYTRVNRGSDQQPKIHQKELDCLRRDFRFIADVIGSVILYI